jgi:DNA-directed RNA polymerase subunit L
MPKPKRPSGALPAALTLAAEQFREQVRPAFGAVEAIATRVEELMGRSGDENTTFLGGSLLPVITYAVLHQSREEVQESVAALEKGEPSDVVDRTDFFASALSEMAALIKILTTMELDPGSALREDWDKLADDLQALAQRVQRAAEKFEDQIEASEDHSPFRVIN